MAEFYSVIVLDIALMMIIMILFANGNDLLEPRKRRLFILLFCIIIAATLSEWSGSLTYLTGHGLRQFHIFTKVVELSLTPMVPFLCAEVLESENHSRHTRQVLCWILVIHALLEVFSAFFGFIFYVDADSIFHHGPFYVIYLFTYLGGSVYVLWEGHHIIHSYQSRGRIVLVLLLGYLLLGVFFNQYNTSIKVAWLTVSIVVMLFYVFYDDMIQRMDEMTSLLNHTSYNSRLARLRKPATLLFLDVDSFKAINDQYGHLYGDHCLETIGKIIRKVYGRSGTCYRVGGDEFCVILSDGHAAVEEMNSQFFANMQQERDADFRIPYVSIGYAYFDPDKGQVSSALQEADTMMYRFKERNKIKHIPAVSPPEPEPSPIIPAAPSAEPALDTSGLTDRAFAAFAATNDRSYLYLCNMDTNVSRWSRTAVDYFGLPGEYMYNAGTLWAEYIHPEDREMYLKDIQNLFAGRTSVHAMEYRAKNRYGEYVVCTCRGIILKGNGEDPDLFAGSLINHGIIDGVDPVTGLHNSSEFTKRIRRLIAENSAVCVIKVGIEHFRHINAMYGHQGGNRILKLFGVELRELIQGRGGLFRLDGAKFAIYLYNTNRADIQQFYDRIQEIAETHIEIDDLRIPLRIYGGAMMVDHNVESDTTVRSGIIYAMERSQESRGELVFLEDVMAGSSENIALHRHIHRSAMENCRGFFLLYQPILSFETGRMIGAEALLRWEQEPYGIVPPNNFIPWLENDPAFISVGCCALRRALRETQPLRALNPEFVVNVNVAVTQLEHHNFREDVLRILEETGCPPQNLCLELTERCRLLDLEFLAGELTFFRQHGISIALDDFGTGSSSLSLLLELPIDVLKVDRTFVDGLHNSRSHRNMIEFILQVSRREGYCACVEGIETGEEYELIKSLGGDCYQGYYSSRPIPPNELLRFLQEPVK